MKAILLGATKGMGRSLARQLAARGDRLFLLGRDAEDPPKALPTSRFEVNTGAGSGSEVGWALCDLEDTATFAAALDAAEKALGGFDTVIVTAGLFATQDQLEADVALAERLLRVDFTNTVVFCEHARKRLLERRAAAPSASSLRWPATAAASRWPSTAPPRPGFRVTSKRSTTNSAPKASVTLDVKPGFVKTGMTAGLKPPPFAGEPEAVAARVIKAIEGKEAAGLRALSLALRDAGHPLACRVSSCGASASGFLLKAFHWGARASRPLLPPWPRPKSGARRPRSQ